jgi:hypothetical protein
VTESKQLFQAFVATFALRGHQRLLQGQAQNSDAPAFWMTSIQQMRSERPNLHCYIGKIP